MRLYMFQLTVEKTVLQLLNLSPEYSKWSDHITWSDIKKKLFHIIPKMDIRQATRKLMKIGMKEIDQVRLFTARIMTKYIEVCDLYGVQSLPVSLNHTIACTVTANMNSTARNLYYDCLKENPQKITIEMEKSFSNVNFKKSLFHHETNSAQCEVSTTRHSFNHYPYRQEGESNVAKNVWKGRSFRKEKCWFFQRGTCKFAMMPNGCRYEHISTMDRY